MKDRFDLIAEVCRVAPFDPIAIYSRRRFVTASGLVAAAMILNSSNVDDPNSHDAGIISHTALNDRLEPIADFNNHDTV